MKYAINKLSDEKRFTLEENSQTTITVPDFALSVREIMVKFATGLPTPVAGTGYFSNDFPDVNKMDIIDLWKMKRSNSEHMKMLDEKRKNAEQNVINYKQEMDLKQIEEIIENRTKNQQNEKV